MIATTTKQAKPCASCGTTGGNTPRDQCTPIRRNGRNFGFEGSLCAACYHRCRRKHTTSAKRSPRCDLCGCLTTGIRLPGAEFDLEGLICLGCILELRQERQDARDAAVRIRITAFRPTDGRLYVGPGGYRLPVLDQHVRFSEYTPKLAALMIRREFRAMERRAS